jgi:putative transposase
MKKTKFTEAQIIGILKEQEQGMKVSDLCRKHGISDATFYNWKNKYAGMSVDELKRLKELEQENAQLKKIVANPPFNPTTLPRTIQPRASSGKPFRPSLPTRGSYSNPVHTPETGTRQLATGNWQPTRIRHRNTSTKKPDLTIGLCSIKPTSTTTSQVRCDD